MHQHEYIIPNSGDDVLMLSTWGIPCDGRLIEACTGTGAAAPVPVQQQSKTTLGLYDYSPSVISLHCIMLVLCIVLLYPRMASIMYQVKCLMCLVYPLRSEQLLTGACSCVVVVLGYPALSSLCTVYGLMG